MDDEVTLKFIILGDSGVGKTNLLLRYVGESFSENYIATLGIDFKMKNIIYNDLKIALQIWDTAGQERFRSITKSFLKGTDGIIFMYDISKKDSFLNLKNWIAEIDNSKLAEIDNSKLPDVKFVICGNKIDLEENREVTEEMKKKLSKEFETDIIEISAKKGIKIEEPFDMLINKIFNNMNKEQIFRRYANSFSEGSSLSSLNIEKKKKKCC